MQKIARNHGRWSGGLEMARLIRLRERMVEVCRRLQELGLVTATDGNVSCRAGDGLLVTPSGTVKGALRPKDLLCVDLDGRVLGGSGKPSSELKMHLLVYRRRSDVNAVVHAHPPILTAMTLAGQPFLSEALPEVWLTLGRVPTAPYATPSTEEVPTAIEPFVADHQALLLERHGSLTFGGDLRQAYLRTEKLEQAARTLFIARQLSGAPVAGLSAECLAALAAAFAPRTG
jgi:L-fuculose-phosphate aldolase